MAQCIGLGGGGGLLFFSLSLSLYVCCCFLWVFFSFFEGAGGHLSVFDVLVSVLFDKNLRVPSAVENPCQQSGCARVTIVCHVSKKKKR